MSDQNSLDSVANLFDDTNRISTEVQPIIKDLPKRYIFTRIENTNDLLLRIDNSSLERFQTCPRSAQYALIESRESHGSAATTFGSIIHECLEHIYKNSFDETTYRQCIKILETRFAQAQMPSDEWRSLELAAGVIQKYFNKYQTDLSTYQPQFVEKAFSLPLCTIAMNRTLPISSEKLLGETGNEEHVYVANLQVYWSGKTDLCMETRVGGTKMVWDHKTTSILGPNFFLDFEFNQQTVGYVWATKRLLELSKYPGFVLNAIAVRKPTKTGTSIELERMPYAYSKQQIAEWELDIQYHVLDFMSHLKQGYFPKSTKWCHGKYGSCPYFGVCSQPEPRERNGILHSNAYADSTWTPFIKPEPMKFND